MLLALDGLKTVWSYLGDPAALGAVIAELEPLVRAQGESWLLQWVVFEKSFVAAAEGRLDEAQELVTQALEHNRRSHFPAYGAYMRAHSGWFARLAGDLDAAERVGQQALGASSPAEHPWWHATAAGLLAATLLERGRAVDSERVARRALADADASTAPAGRLRCAAVLALATGDGAATAAATALLDAVECPPGQAWVVGADCYLALARATLTTGDSAGATRLLEPLRAATRRSWPMLREQVDELLLRSAPPRAEPPVRRRPRGPAGSRSDS